LALPCDASAAPRLAAPPVAATATVVKLKASGLKPRERVRLERRRDGRWARVRRGRAGRQGRETFRVRPAVAGRQRFRVVGRSGRSRVRTLRSRAVRLAAIGDINLGDGPRAVMRVHGVRYPWRRVAPLLRGADIAFGNLECAVSRRGSPVPKLFTFRGRPAALRAAVRFAGMDVFNLANNHALDYGRRAFKDSVRLARRYGATTVGAGWDLQRARRPRVVTRLGLRVAFVGFSDILPFSFAATPTRSGTAFAFPAAVRRSVRRANRRADVVVATFHWGQERSTRPNARQRMFARIALHAGADAVIGAHPHVLQPTRRRGRRVVAYSLGNFIWTPTSAITARTGILDVRLSGRGVERARLRRARIVGGQPRLTG
jgi:poly-gamma-glutamate synthesis protein (capsule biosynthesis protein)